MCGEGVRMRLDPQVVRPARERQKLNYDQELKEQYKHMPETGWVARRRHIPKHIPKARETMRARISGYIDIDVAQFKARDIHANNLFKSIVNLCVPR